MDVFPLDVVFDVQEHEVTGVNLVDVMTAGTALTCWSTVQMHQRKARLRMLADIRCTVPAAPMYLTHGDWEGGDTYASCSGRCGAQSARVDNAIARVSRGEE